MLKFTDPNDLLTSYSSISSLWYRTSPSEELWSDLCDQESIPKLSFPTYRAAFRSTTHTLKAFLVVHLLTPSFLSVYDVSKETTPYPVAPCLYAREPTLLRPFLST